jgi:hypothetical protein
MENLSASLGVAKAKISNLVDTLNIFAFVTGPIRESYYSKQKSQQDVMNKVVGDVIDKGIGAKPYSAIFGHDETYFLDKEGILELCGMLKMYEQISKGTIVPFAGFGMGLSSCQMTVMGMPSENEDPFKNFSTFDHGGGMDSVPNLRAFPEAFREYLEEDEKHENMNRFVESALVVTRTGRQPVIGLKGGCTLYLMKHAQTRRALAAFVPKICFESRPILVTFVWKQQKRKVYVPPSSTIARLLAIAKEQFGFRGYFVNLTREDGRIVNENDIRNYDLFYVGELNSSATWWVSPSGALHMLVPSGMITDFTCNYGSRVEHWQWILNTFFSTKSHRLPNSFECVAHVLKLLYGEVVKQNEGNVCKDFLQVAEKWFSQMLTTAKETNRKLIEMMGIQMIPEHIRALVCEFKSYEVKKPSNQLREVILAATQRMDGFEVRKVELGDAYIFVQLVEEASMSGENGLSFANLKRLLHVLNKEMKVVRCNDRIRPEPMLFGPNMYVVSLNVLWQDEVYQVYVHVENQLSPLLRLADDMNRKKEMIDDGGLFQTPNSGAELIRRAGILESRFKRSLVEGWGALTGVVESMHGGIKSEESLRRKLASESGPKEFLIPFAFLIHAIAKILKEWNQVIDYVPTLDNGCKEGFRETLHFLQKLWHMDDERWKAVRTKLQIGFIEHAGDVRFNLSLGVAKHVQTEQKQPFALLHLSTSSSKFVIYDGNQKLTESKTKAVNIQSFVCGSYDPAKHGYNEISTADIQAALKKEFTCEKSIYAFVYVFVTGPIRDVWEHASPEVKTLMETRIADLLRVINAQPLPNNNNSFFLQKVQEAKYEFNAAEALYRSLENQNQLPQGTKPVATLSLGRTNCRYFMPKAPTDLDMGHDMNSRADSCMYWKEEGMDNCEKMPFADSLFDFIFENKSTLVTWTETTGQPVIAAKGGCTMFMVKNPWARHILTSPPSFIFDYLRATYTLVPNGLAPILQELLAVLRVLQEKVGPILRIKDQTKKGFIIVNLLVSQQAETPMQQLAGTLARNFCVFHALHSICLFL